MRFTFVESRFIPDPEPPPPVEELDPTPTKRVRLLTLTSFSSVTHALTKPRISRIPHLALSSLALSNFSKISPCALASSNAL
jgi:hypothetical protein